MAILSTQPYVDADGFSYPFLGVNIISRADFTNPKKLGAPAVLNLFPYRVEADGTIIQAPPEAMRSVLISDCYEQVKTDPALAQLFGGTLSLIAQFVAAKGL